MNPDREQAIKDVSQAVDDSVDMVSAYTELDNFGDDYGKAVAYAVSQRERVIALERALRTLERIVTELYPGDVEPDAEHLGEYQAVWSAVMNARAALENK